MGAPIVKRPEPHQPARPLPVRPATPERHKQCIPSRPEGDGNKGWWECKALRVSRRL